MEKGNPIIWKKKNKIPEKIRPVGIIPKLKPLAILSIKLNPPLKIRNTTTAVIIAA